MIDMSIEELRQAAKYLGGYYEQIMNQVIDHLEAVDKEIESWKGVAKQLGNDADTLRIHLSFAKDELNRLRGVLEEMEKQEPVARFNWSKGKIEWLRPWNYSTMNMKPLYLAPGAQGEEK